MLMLQCGPKVCSNDNFEADMSFKQMEYLTKARVSVVLEVRLNHPRVWGHI